MSSSVFAEIIELFRPGANYEINQFSQERDYLEEHLGELSERYEVHSVKDIRENTDLVGRMSRGTYIRKVLKGKSNFPAVSDNNPAEFFVLEHDSEVKDILDGDYLASVSINGDIHIQDKDILSEAEFDEFLSNWHDWRSNSEPGEYDPEFYRSGPVRVFTE